MKYEFKIDNLKVINFYFLESFNLWCPLMIVDFYH